MQDYRKLDVWTKAHDLTLELYRATARVPGRSFPGLVSQMRRSASSIPANIVEGCGHSTQGELARFLQIACASANELSYHLLLARDLGALGGVPYARLEARTTQVRQMLAALIRTVRRKVSEAKAAARATVTEPP